MKKAIVMVTVVAITGIVIVGLARKNGIDFVQIEDNLEEVKEEA